MLSTDYAQGELTKLELGWSYNLNPRRQIHKLMMAISLNNVSHQNKHENKIYIYIYSRRNLDPDYN